MNENGKMEFPRDLMMQDCLANQVEPLYGFVTNVTLLSDQPCIEDVECTVNGTRIDSEDEILSEGDDIPIDIDDNAISNINGDNVTMTSDNNVRFLSNARISFSDPDLSSNIDYAEAKYYIKKYTQDQRHVSITPDTAELNYSGKPEHSHRYLYNIYITDSLKHIYLYTIHIFMLKVFADRQMKSLEEELHHAERDGQGELVAEEGMYA